MVLDEIELIKGDLHQTEEKLAKLLIRSPAQGNFVLIDARNLSGRFVKKGELLGYIVSEHRPTIRAVVSQADIGLVRERVTGVEVRLTEQPAESLKADIERIVPAADLNLPSAALGTAGGGVRSGRPHRSGQTAGPGKPFSARSQSAGRSERSAYRRPGLCAF